jgi:adenylate cyclase
MSFPARFYTALKAIKLKAVLKALRHPSVGCAVICLLIFALVAAVRAFGWLQRPELMAYDYFLRQQVDPAAADDRIVIVGMTESDLRKFGFPIGDDLLANVLEIIDSQKPVAVGLDLYRDLPEPRDGSQIPRLTKILKESDRMIGIERMGFIAPPKALDEAQDRIAGNNLTKDSVDGVFRHGPLFIKKAGRNPRPSFSLLLAVKYLESKGVEFAFESSKDPVTGEESALIRLGKTLLPRMDGNAGGYVKEEILYYEYLANFAAPQHHLHAESTESREPGITGEYAVGRNTAYDYSFGEVLGGLLPEGALTGKIVLVATVMESVKDSNPTPINPDLRGVQYHAMLTHQLLEAGLNDKAPMTWWPDWAELLWIAGCTLLSGLLALWLRSPWKLAPAIALVLAGIFFGGHVAFQHGLWLLVAAPTLGATLAAAGVTSYVVALERADRNVMQSLFSKHVSKKVADVLFRERDQFMDGGRMAARSFTGTVVFTDLVGFSTASEKLTSVEIISWLNEYMEVMAGLVEDHEGTVNKYMGDAIMAVFGAPIIHQDEIGVDVDAVHAVRCALHMRQAVPILNDRWRSAGSKMPSVAMRIGIFTGQLVDGSFGSAERLEWTVIGDTVNRANRLESAGKEIRDQLNDDEKLCSILIGPEVYSRVGHHFETVPVPDMTLKGITGKVTVYRVLSERVPSPTASTSRS